MRHWFLAGLSHFPVAGLESGMLRWAWQYHRSSGVIRSGRRVPGLLFSLRFDIQCRLWRIAHRPLVRDHSDFLFFFFAMEAAVNAAA